MRMTIRWPSDQVLKLRDHVILKFSSRIKIVLLQVWLQNCVALADHLVFAEFSFVSVSPKHMCHNESTLKTWRSEDFFIVLEQLSL